MNNIPELQFDFCPYQGLEPFTEADKDYFVGRDADTRLIASNLLGVPLSVLYGVSGVGKSSVLLAGVVPRLKRKPGLAVTVFRHWQGDEFAEQLKQKIAEAVQPNTRQEARLDQSLPLDEFLRQCNEALDGPVFLIFDQWEEYFLYHPTENSFDLELARAINRHDVTAHFLLAMREEELSKLDRFRTSIPNVLGNMLRLKHLDSEAAEQAIRRPLNVFNQRVPADRRVTIEDELVNSLIEKSARRDEHEQRLAASNGQNQEECQIATPVLQLLLTRLWDEERQQNSTAMRAATLDRLGGAQNVVDDYFENVIEQLPGDQRQLAGRTFGYLVAPAGGKLAQTPATLARWAKEKDAAPVRKLLDGLSVRSDIRILRKVVIAGRPDQYEIFHDVLGPSVLKWQQKFEHEEIERLAKEQAAKETEEHERELEQIRRIAELERRRADEQEHLNRKLHSTALAVRAILQAAMNPELSLKMSLEAASLAYTPEAEDALRQSVAAKLQSRLYSVLQDKDVVSSSVFSSNGQFILTASGDKTAKLWDARTGKLIRTFIGHEDDINGAAFSPDSQFVVTASRDNTARVWDMQTGGQIWSLDGHTDVVWSAAYSPDGRFIITASDDTTVRIWNAQTAKFIRTCGKHVAPVMNAVYSPDAQLIVTASTTVQVWNASTDELITSLGQQDDIAYFYRAAFSPNGEFILLARADGNTKVHSVTEHKIVNEFNSAQRSVFSYDSRLIVTCSEVEAVRILDAATGTIVMEFKGHEHCVNGAAFSPDGNFIVTASDDGTAKVWSTQSNKSFTQLTGHTKAVGQATYSQNGKLIVTVSDDGTAKVWEADTGQIITEISSKGFRTNNAGFSPDGDFLVTANDIGTATVYNTQTGDIITTLTGHLSDAKSATYHPNGHFIVTASTDKTAMIWDAKTGTLVNTLKGHKSHLYHARYSSDGEFIVTVSYDTTAIVWNASTGEVIASLEGHKSPVLNASFSPDSQFVVTAGYDRRAIVWNANSGKIIRELKGHNGMVKSAYYSPDGKCIITSCSDNSIRVFNAETGDKISELNNQITNVWDVSYSPSGKSIVTAGNDCIARIFPATLFAPFDELKEYGSRLLKR